MNDRPADNPLIVVATGNRHKVQEISRILGSEIRCLGMQELGEIPPWTEDGTDFAAVARQKCENLLAWLDANGGIATLSARPAATFLLADDSGLEVDYLDGAPGVRSARFAAEDHSETNAPDERNNAKLLSLLKDVPRGRRNARFVCALALLPYSRPPEKPARIFTGCCEGRIAPEPGGSGGFGYDPLFIPQGYDRTFAELGEAIKNRISHRARALDQLKTWFSRSKTATALLKH